MLEDGHSIFRGEYFNTLIQSFAMENAYTVKCLQCQMTMSDQ